jgi:hypothetical protein
MIPQILDLWKGYLGNKFVEFHLLGSESANIISLLKLYVFFDIRLPLGI